MSATVSVQELHVKPVPAILLKAQEEKAQRLMMVYAITGLFFMLLPGTFLGVWNLISISGHRGAAIPASWIQAHGHAQIFGWIGTFILGIGFYSIPKMASRTVQISSRGWATWMLWTAGVLLRWAAGFYHLYWRVVLPFSALLELRFPHFPGLRQRPSSIRFEATIPAQACLDDCSPGWDRRLWHRTADEPLDGLLRQCARHRPRIPSGV